MVSPQCRSAPLAVECVLRRCDAVIARDESALRVQCDVDGVTVPAEVEVGVKRGDANRDASLQWQNSHVIRGSKCGELKVEATNRTNQAACDTHI